MTIRPRSARLLCRLGIVLLAPALLGTSLAAHAASTYTYAIRGGVSQYDPKIRADSIVPFDGTITWDTSANDGNGGWSDWDIQLGGHNMGGPFLTFNSENKGIYRDLQSKTQFPLNINAGAPAGVLSSPLGSGSKVAGGEFSVGGISSLNLFSVFQVTNTASPFAWNDFSDDGDKALDEIRAKEGRYSYFRLPFISNGYTLAFASGDFASNESSGYGLSMLPHNPAEGGGKTCPFTDREPPPAGSCPFSGQSLRRATLVPDGVGSRPLKITLKETGSQVGDNRVQGAGLSCMDGSTTNAINDIKPIVGVASIGTNSTTVVPNSIPAGGGVSEESDGGNCNVKTPAPLAVAGVLITLGYSRRLRQRRRSVLA